MAQSVIVIKFSQLSIKKLCTCIDIPKKYIQLNKIKNHTDNPAHKMHLGFIRREDVPQTFSTLQYSTVNLPCFDFNYVEPSHVLLEIKL